MKKDNGIVYAAALALREREACYAELQPLDDGWRLAGAQMFALPHGCMSGTHIADGTLLGDFLRKNLRFRWKKAPLIIGIPTTECFHQLLTLPVASVEEVREVLRWNFSSYFPFPREDALYDVSEVNMPVPDASGAPALVVAAMKKEILPLCEALRSLSACVDAVEPVGVACARAVMPPSVYDRGGCVLLTVQCGATVQFALINDGTGLMFRSASYDAETGLNDDALGAVKDEFLKTLAYVRSRFSCAPSLCVAGEDKLFAAVSEVTQGKIVERTGISELHCLELGPGAGKDWYDVAGLLLRYADEDRV